MKSKLLVAALVGLAIPASADIVTVTVDGTTSANSAFTAVWTAETGCANCDYASGYNDPRFPDRGPSPILSASLTINGVTTVYQGNNYGAFYAYNDQSVDRFGQLYSAFYINISMLPAGGFAMNNFVDFYSIDLPGNINAPFSLAVAATDKPLGSFTYAGASGYLYPEHVTLTNPLYHTPGPIVGTGLPGLVLTSGALLLWWCRKRLS